MRPSHQQSRKFLRRHGWPLGLFSILQTVNYIYEWWEWRHLEDTGSCSRLPHRRRWWLKTCTLVLHPFITQTPNGHRCIKTTGNWQQQMTDEKRGCPCLHISARTFCITVSNFVVSLLCRPEMAHRAQIREHKKKKKTTSNSQSQCTKIALLQPHDSLDYPRRSPPSDVTRYEKWWIQDLVSCISDGWKGKTNKEEDNPQIGTAVWRGYYWKKTPLGDVFRFFVSLQSLISWGLVSNPGHDKWRLFIAPELLKKGLLRSLSVTTRQS